MGMVGPSTIVLTVTALALASCDGGSKSGTPPCIVGEDEMASILDRDDVLAAPQKNGLECIYASGGDPLILVTVRTREQFQAERDRFESTGVKLPPLEPVDGFAGEANTDPRYNSLNVTSGERIVSVQVVSPEPSNTGDQLDLEKRIARAAVERL
jgi:hypothetical protein